MNIEEFGVFVTHLPGTPSIGPGARAVIVPVSCVELAQLCIVIRHEGGTAQFGPLSALGVPTTEELLRGAGLHALLDHEVARERRQRRPDAVSFSLN